MACLIFKRSGEDFEVLIDDEDLHYIHGRTWRIIKNRAGNMYLRGRAKGDRTGALLHRLIMGVNDRAIIIDHKNRNGLDNRKTNLRKCNQSQNQANKKRISSNPYKGIVKHKRIKNPWGGND